MLELELREVDRKIEELEKEIVGRNSINFLAIPKIVDSQHHHYKNPSNLVLFSEDEICGGFTEESNLLSSLNMISPQNGEKSIEILFDEDVD